MTDRHMQRLQFLLSNPDESDKSRGSGLNGRTKGAAARRSVTMI